MKKDNKQNQSTIPKPPNHYGIAFVSPPNDFKSSKLRFKLWELIEERYNSQFEKYEHICKPEFFVIEYGKNLFSMNDVSLRTTRGMHTVFKAHTQRRDCLIYVFDANRNVQNFDNETVQKLVDSLSSISGSNSPILLVAASTQLIENRAQAVYIQARINECNPTRKMVCTVADLNCPNDLDTVVEKATQLAEGYHQVESTASIKIHTLQS